MKDTKEEEYTMYSLSNKLTNLQVVVLSLLFCLQVESSQTTQVLLTHSLVHLHKTNLLTNSTYYLGLLIVYSCLNIKIGKFTFFLQLQIHKGSTYFTTASSKHHYFIGLRKCVGVLACMRLCVHVYATYVRLCGMCALNYFKQSNTNLFQ